MRVGGSRLACEADNDGVYQSLGLDDQQRCSWFAAMALQTMVGNGCDREDGKGWRASNDWTDLKGSASSERAGATYFRRGRPRLATRGRGCRCAHRTRKMKGLTIQHEID